MCSLHDNLEPVLVVLEGPIRGGSGSNVIRAVEGEGRGGGAEVECGQQIVQFKVAG